MEKIVETHICKHCGASFDITDKDLEFYEKVSPVFPSPGVSFSTPGLKLLENGKIKYLIPPPTLCPDCRQQRRLSFRNERKLYKRKCNFSGKDIISIYSPDKPYKVYSQDIWWSDKWEAMDYGRDFDFNKSFFEQFEELMKEVPKPNILSKMSENCEYVSSVGNSKNCYLVFNSDFCENSLYSSIMKNSKNICDGLHIYNCEEVYNSINCTDSYNLINCFECDNSSYLFGCAKCTGCSYCFDSCNLINKKYFISSNQVSKEKWEEFYKILTKSQLRNQGICRNLYIIDSENFNGSNIYKSKNVSNSYNIGNCENIKNSTLLTGAQNCYDVDSYGGDLELGYESNSIGYYVSKIAFGDIITSSCSEIYYSSHIIGCSHTFGCVGLRNKSYCILNKQYTKEEYEALVPKIISHMMKTGEWGEFFPSSLSPFGYNETVAQEYFPINPPVLMDIPLIKGDSQNGVEAGEFYYIDREGNTYNTLKEAGKRLVFKWSTYEAPFPKVEKIIPASKLPENIADIPNDILNWAIECEVTKKPFRIIKEELEFYRKHNLPIPRRHPDQRHLDRMHLRNPRKLFERICDCPTCEENHKNIGKYKEEEFAINTKTGKKGKSLQTTYAPERPEIVYCEECYNKEIY